MVSTDILAAAAAMLFQRQIILALLSYIDGVNSRTASAAASASLGGGGKFLFSFKISIKAQRWNQMILLQQLL